MTERGAAPEAKGSSEHEQPPQHAGKVPLHRVALHHATGQPRAPHVSGGVNGMPYVVPMDMYSENRGKLCTRLQAQGAPPAGVVLMEGGKEEYRHESDTEKLFRQESSFAYLFGVRACVSP